MNISGIDSYFKCAYKCSGIKLSDYKNITLPSYKCPFKDDNSFGCTANCYSKCNNSCNLNTT
jgi:hypothetical protein